MDILVKVCVKNKLHDVQVLGFHERKLISELEVNQLFVLQCLQKENVHN